MNTIDLAIIGLSQEDLQARLIETLCDRAMTGISYDEDGDPWKGDSRFAVKLKDAIQKRIDAAVDLVADTHITPLLAGKIESFTLQATNEWGEAKGAPVSFIEYLTERAEKYMIEPVDSNGKSEAECRRSGNSFYGKGTTRISQAIDKHLEYSIKVAMERALADAQSQITKSMAEACKMALADVQQKLKVTVATK